MCCIRSPQTGDKRPDTVRTHGPSNSETMGTLLNLRTESDGPMNVRDEPDNEQTDFLGEQSRKKGKRDAFGAQGRKKSHGLDHSREPRDMGSRRVHGEKDFCQQEECPWGRKWKQGGTKSSRLHEVVGRRTILWKRVLRSMRIKFLCQQ